jgi:hypothetical protein
MLKNGWDKMSGICKRCGGRQVSLGQIDGSGTRTTHGDPLLWVDNKHLANQVLRIRRHVGRHNKLAELDFLEEDADVFVVERKATGQKGEQDDPARPDVGSGTVVGQTLKYG